MTARAYGGIALLIGLGLTGCAQTSNAGPTTTLTPLPVPAQTTTTTIAVPPPEVVGYGQGIVDGRTFQLSVGQQTQVVTMTHLVAPDPSSCEGAQAKNLLGSIVIGHVVRLGNDGIVWRDDVGLDVAKTMVQYGMVKAADTVYQANDDTSVDFNCANTTTTAPVVVATEAPPPVQQPRRKPTTTTAKPRPKRTTPPDTAAEADQTPAPAETAAPAPKETTSQTVRRTTPKTAAPTTSPATAAPKAAAPPPPPATDAPVAPPPPTKGNPSDTHPGKPPKDTKPPKKP